MKLFPLLCGLSLSCLTLTQSLHTKRIYQRSEVSLRAGRKKGGEMETAGVSICSVEAMADQYGGLAVFRHGAQYLSDTYHQSHRLLWPWPQ